MHRDPGGARGAVRGGEGVALLLTFLLLVSPAFASSPVGGDVPLPPARPLGLSDQERVSPSQAPVPPVRPPGLGEEAPPQSPPPPSAVLSQGGECASLLASGHAMGRVETPIVGPGACGIAAPIELSEIVLPNGDPVTIHPPALMGCSLASALSDWVREDLAPAVSASGERLSVINDAGSYDCRGRDGIAGAILSEHAKGDAIDITALGSKTAPFFTVLEHPETALAHAFRDSACRRFSTVLGPGADGYHSSHVHLDLEPRRNHGHFCQWNLPEGKSALVGEKSSQQAAPRR